MNVDATGKARGVLSPEVRDLSVGDEGSVITSIETYALAVPLARPIADATAAMSHWTVPVVEVRTADGRVGTGISGVHCGPELLCDVIENYYAQALLGASSQDISATWKRLYWLPTHWIGRAGVVHMALAMVDIALWDLAAPRAAVPLWRLLGGTADPIEAYNTDAGWLNLSTDELVRDLVSLTDQGWRRVKKVGKPDWREDARRVRAVRNQLGDDVTLMCDANQRWDLATASRIMPVLEEAQLDWVEEPRHLRGPAADRVHPLDARRVHPPQRHP
jgi:L-alanine-DL-glutamate epimerase-like enolase superfamily enzyme